MTIHHISVWLGLAAAGMPWAGAVESNIWPGPVTQTDAGGNPTSWTALGPFLFDEPESQGGRVAGFRPFLVRRTDPAGEQVETTSFYPLFYLRRYDDTYEWSIFKIINRYGRGDGASPSPATEPQTFDVWPFYFSKDTGDPATSRHALLPVAGTVEGHLGYDRISWVLFPLYARTETRGSATTYTPWPILRVTQGAEQGFAIWPLFGRRERPGAAEWQYFVWPLFWNNTIQPGPDAAPGTPATRQVGFLPFFTSERGPGLVDECYAWPFFGYTDRTAPYRYSEIRYFWPFLVQGLGDDRQVSRWAPFYTHSVIKGVDKTWAPWPLLRLTTWTEGTVAQSKTQFIYFIYWRLEQRSTTNPAAAPAEKTYLWPLISTWDNGAGRRQVEVLSPFEGMFADNPEARAAWSPLFAVWRFDQRAPGETRTSVLWSAVTWSRSASEARSEFHLGPILGVESGPEGTSWRLFGLEFGSKGHKVAASVR